VAHGTEPIGRSIEPILPQRKVPGSKTPRGTFGHNTTEAMRSNADHKTLQNNLCRRAPTGLKSKEPDSF
jgi:hypothetical protein